MTRDYLRPFTAAREIVEHLQHLHALAHYTLNQFETLEANMATQDDINKIADQINTAVTDLTAEIAAAKNANPDVDLSGIQSAVDKLSALDTANAAPAEPAPVDTTPAPVDETPAPDAPVADSDTPATGANATPGA